MKIKHAGTRKKGTDYFWRYDSIAREMYSAIQGMKRGLVKSEVGNMLSFAFVPNTSIVSHVFIIFLYDLYEI